MNVVCDDFGCVTYVRDLRRTLARRGLEWAGVRALACNGMRGPSEILMCFAMSVDVDFDPQHQIGT